MCNASVNKNCIGRNHIPYGKALYTSTGCLLCRCMGSDKKEYSRGSESNDPCERAEPLTVHAAQATQARWLRISLCQVRSGFVESLSVKTKQNPIVSYDFSAKCYKFPNYLRRAAIVEAFGKVSSYRSNLANWEAAESVKRGKHPSLPQVGYVYPAMYRSGMFVCTEMYRATVNVFIRNTWDWVLVDFRKSDADYILRRCKNCKECVLALQKRGKKWFLDFVFQTSAKLPDVPIKDTSILAVDLGLNSACTCSIMTRSARSSERNFFPFRENATPWNMR